MTTESLTIPLNKLVPWKNNVRKSGPKVGIDELKASIVAHGLLQSLVVKKDEGGKYAVIAGRRRLFALQALAKEGAIKQSYAVPCSEMDADADPTEISLAENFQREQMHPADEFEAFKKLNDDGLSGAEIAARNGVTEKLVESRLRLANVSPKLIKAYRDGECSLQHMMAFAVTTDHEAQEKVWRDLPAYRRNDPEAVRDQLTESEITAKDRRVKFVGLAAYEKAGGQIRRDLFSSDEDGAFILDKELLADLVAKKLEKIAEGVRKQGWKWVEVRENFQHAEWSSCQRRYEEAAPLAPKEQAKLDELNAQLAALIEADDGEENPEADKLQVKIDKLEDRPRAWQPETLAIAGAVVSIGFDGKPQIDRGLVKPEDAPKQHRKKAAVNGSGEPVEDSGAALSSTLIENLTTHRTAALQAVLKDKPEVALAALVHTLAGQLFYLGGHDDAVKIRLTETRLTAVEETKAVEALAKDEEKWKAKLPGKVEELWAWCVRQKPPVLHDLLAFCVARSVDAIATKGDSLAHERFRQANELAKAVGLEMTDWFTATAENYFGRVSKASILEAIKEAKIEITPAMEKAKKAELAATAEREIGKVKWLPELLRGQAP